MQESPDWPQRSPVRGRGALAAAALAAVLCSAWRGEPVPLHAERHAQYRDMAPLQAPMREIVVYASDLPKRALSDFAFSNDAASPEGRMLGTANNGDELDPPPENDPHVTFKVTVEGGVPYRCWIHMKVGAPQGKSQSFRTSGEVTVRLQAGMEGVGFDQFLLSSTRFLESPPTEPVVAKPRVVATP